MTRELEHLERLVEQELHLLEGLPEVAPRPECLARVKQAVVREAARFRARPRWPAVAAAALLALGLARLGINASAPQTPASSPLTAMVDEAEALDLWAEAVDESSQELAFLLEEGWLLNGSGTNGDDALELDGFLEGLDRFFDSLDAL